MKIEENGATYDVVVKKGNYSVNNALAVILLLKTGEPFATLSVNLADKKLPKNCAYVDTNNLKNAEEFIEANKLGTFTGEYGYSGFCKYPLYKFK